MKILCYNLALYDKLSSSPQYKLIQSFVHSNTILCCCSTPYQLLFIFLHSNILLFVFITLNIKYTKPPFLMISSKLFLQSYCLSSLEPLFHHFSPMFVSLYFQICMILILLILVLCNIKSNIKLKQNYLLYFYSLKYLYERNA